MTAERERLEKIPGVRLKVRTFEKDGNRWASVALWVDDEQRAEFATLRIDDVDPGSPLYHGWIDAVSRFFYGQLAAACGLPGLQGKREKPNYKGEQ